MNKVVLLGRLGGDAELKVTQGGQAVSKFSLATSEKWKDKDGELQERTEWHRCVFWGDRAKKLNQYLTKGKQILVEGSIRYGSYEKDGVKMYTTDINVMNVEFAGDAKNGGGKKESRDDAPTAETPEDYASGGAGAYDESPF